MSQSFDKMSWGRIVDTSLCRKKMVQHTHVFKITESIFFKKLVKSFRILVQDPHPSSKEWFQFLSVVSEFATKGNLISKPA